MANMKILDQMGAAIGIGGAHVQMRVDSRLYQGGQAEGVVTVHGGAVPQRVRGFTVRLVQRWEQEDEDGHSVREERTVREESYPAEAEVGPRVQRSFPFRFAVPLGCAPDRSEEAWELRVTADLTGGVDPSCAVDVEVLPPEAVLTLSRAVERLGWEPASIGRSDDGRGAFALRFTPPAGMGQDFDDLKLHVRPRGGDLEVRAVLDLAERGLTDYLRAAVGLDEKEQRFTVSTTALDEPRALAVLQAFIAQHRPA